MQQPTEKPLKIIFPISYVAMILYRTPISWRNMGQKRTFHTMSLQSKGILIRRTRTLTSISLQSRCESHLQTCRYKEGRLHWSYMRHISKYIGRKLGRRICTTCTSSWSLPCALHGGNLHFFISPAYFAQSCDEDHWPLTSPLNAILKQLRTSLTIGRKMVRCIIIILVSSSSWSK